MKQLIKGVILCIGAILRRDSRPKVVFYHDVGKKWTPMGTEEEVFWSHMRCLREGDVVCFDDGFRGIWDAREELKAKRSEFSVRVMVFLAVGLVGKPGYLTWDEIRVLQDKYGVEFQCHTWSHQTLTGPWNYEVVVPECGRTEKWYRHELVDSKAEIERQLGNKVDALCFPVGYFSDDVIGMCMDAGYAKVYASYPGNVTDEYVQPRCIAQDLSTVALRAVLNGGMMLLKKHYFTRHYIMEKN